MNTSNSINFKQLDRFRAKCDLLGSLKVNDRLWTSENTLTRSAAPQNRLSNAKHPFLRTLQRISCFIRKLIQNIVRFLTKQTVAKNVGHVKNLTSAISNALCQALPNRSKKTYYTALNKFGYLQKGLQDAKIGLSNYEVTCQSGKAGRGKESKKELGSLAQKVRKMTDNISKKILPILAKKIDELEKKTYASDIKKVNELLSQLKGGDKITADLKSTLFSARAVKDVLRPLYGNTAVNRAIDYYGLTYDLTLSGIDFASLLIGVATNLTIDDLKEIHEQKPSKEQKFEDLSEDDLLLMLSECRKINSKAIEARNNLKYKKQLQHDQKLLEAIHRVEEFNPSKLIPLPIQAIRQFSYTEYLARAISYPLFNGTSYWSLDRTNVQFPEGILVSYYDKVGTPRLKQAHTLVSTKGLNGALFIPAKTSVNSQSEDVEAVFRGTQCWDSVNRDFNPSERRQYFFDGPGRASFAENSKKINDRIMKHAKRLTRANKGLKLNIDFIGHSLGASDAQRAIESFSSRLTKENDHPFEQANLYAYNSPNIEADICKRFIKSVDALKIPFRIRYFNVHHDPAQEFGSKRLGYSGKRVKPSNLSISLVKFNRKVEDRITALARNIFKRARYHFFKSYEAHSYHCFNLYDNDDKKSLNTTFIQDIYTNNIMDTGLKFGRKLNQSSELMDKELLEDALVTTTCRIGRKIKRQFERFKRELSSACYR